MNFNPCTEWFLHSERSLHHEKWVGFLRSVAPTLDVERAIAIIFLLPSDADLEMLVDLAPLVPWHELGTNLHDDIQTGEAPYTSPLLFMAAHSEFREAWLADVSANLLQKENLDEDCWEIAAEYLEMFLEAPTAGTQHERTELSRILASYNARPEAQELEARLRHFEVEKAVKEASRLLMVGDAVAAASLLGRYENELDDSGARKLKLARKRAGMFGP